MLLENANITHHVVKRELDEAKAGPARGKAHEQPVKGLETVVIQYLV